MMYLPQHNDNQVFISPRAIIDKIPQDFFNRLNRHSTQIERLCPGVHKTGIRGIQDTRQIVDGKTNDIENNDKKGGSKPLT